MTTTTQKPVATTPVAVRNEQELNTAISKVNEGSTSNIIDVVESITLTTDLTSIIKTMILQSSNQSVISCGNFNGLSLSNGAKVYLSMTVDGPAQNNGQGDGTTLIGLTGGVVGDLTNNDQFHVPAQNTFKTKTIKGSAEINGVLENSGILELHYPYQMLWNGSGPGGTVGEVSLQNEGLMGIAPSSTFYATRVAIGELSSVSASSPGGTLVVSNGLVLTGKTGSLQTPGTASGISVQGRVDLETGGLFTYAEPGYGCNVDQLNNLSGTFDMGKIGTWVVNSYNQVNGILSMGVEFGSGSIHSPELRLNSCTFQGGQIQINARTYYIPPDFKPLKLVLISSATTLPANLSRLVTLNSFPEGMKVSVEQAERQLYLIMTT